MACGLQEPNEYAVFEAEGGKKGSEGNFESPIDFLGVTRKNRRC